MAASWPSKANYATGDVLTAANMNQVGDNLNDLYAGNTGGIAKAAGKNVLLNSDFSVWQRGTSFTAASGYVADRWYYARYGGATGVTITRQVTNDTTNLPNIQYCMRVQRDSGNTGTGAPQIAQSLESINSIPYAGKQVTLSFYARAGANFSAASSALTAQVISGTGTDQNNLGAGYTGSATPVAGTATLTTTWQRFSYTGTIAATATEFCVYFNYQPVGTASTNDYFEVTGVQIEQNATATPFARNASTYQAELAACQRYYYRLTTASTYSFISSGGASTTTQAIFYVPTPVTMRIAGTSLEQSSMSAFLFKNGSYNSSGTWTLASGNNGNGFALQYTHGSAIFTTGDNLNISNGATATAYFGISAEL